MTDDSSSSGLVVPVSVRENALFLDFDGTLAPLQDDPETVALPDFGAEVLAALRDRLDGALVLISGRDIRDLSKRTPVTQWRAGAHGLEICAPGEAPAPEGQKIDARIREQAAQIIAPFEGVRIEEKGPVLAVHFRANPKAEVQLLQALNAFAAQIEGYKAQHGKMVIELKPLRANKGVALSEIMNQTGFAGRRPIMVGDDTTDEDAMQVAAGLGGFGIKVGDGATLARHRFDSTDRVWDWLRSIVNEHA
ncbi:MAG: trehalose-phosphatase [Pseudomonadota bacterium]